MTPEDRSLLMGELGKIQRTLGELTSTVREHDKADIARHRQLEKRLERLELSAEDTGRHELEAAKKRAAELEKESRRESAAEIREEGKTKRELGKLVVAMVLGAVLSTGTALVGRALGAPLPAPPPPAHEH